MQASERTLSAQICACAPKPNGDYESDKQYDGERPSSRRVEHQAGWAGRESCDRVDDP
jgi:hypothetical protein